MSKGGSKPSKPEPTEYEIALAEQGVQKWNRYIDRYAPLEETELQNLDRSNYRLQAGRTNADLMQEVSQGVSRSLATPNVSAGLENLGRMNHAMTQAMALNSTSSRIDDRNRRDQAHLGAIKRGLGIAGQQTQGLSALASQQNSQALSRYHIENNRNIDQSNATHGALNSLAGSVGGAYMQDKLYDQQASDLFRLMNPNGLYDVADTGGLR